MVATGPRPLSSLDSMTMPLAGASFGALRSRLGLFARQQGRHHGRFAVRLHRTDGFEAMLHQQRKPLGVLTVRNDAGVSAESDLHAGLMGAAQICD